MKTRGEKQYINMPSFAARLYDNLTSVKGVNKGFEEIAAFIDDQLDRGKILDVGTGPGRLLLEINKRNPGFNLSGLDISASMIEVAKQNLQNVNNVDLQVGNIVKTTFRSDYFDVVVSTGSFYNWDNPVEGLNEIFRILRFGKTAYIFESTKDHDKKLLKTRLRSNLNEYGLVRKKLSKYFLNRQLRMTYTTKEFDDILIQTAFKDSYKIERIELGNLPMYVRLELNKS